VPSEQGLGAFASFWSLACIFHFGLLLWAFWCGKLLEGKRITEGKRMAKKRLIESLHQ
jgi:hypothetical protein